MVFKPYCSVEHLFFRSSGKTEPNTKLAEAASSARAFELADDIERGVAREIGTHFLHPVCRESRLKRFHVVRSQDKLQYRLFSEDGNLLMLARQQRAENRVQFFLPDPVEREQGLSPFDHSRPAFTLAYVEKHWRLVQETCEHCAFVSPQMSCDLRGKQQIASISTTWTPVGEEASHQMDVNIPAICSDGSRVVWCPCTGHGDLAKPSEPSCREVLRLRTKQPIWDSDAECMTLTFKGRNVVASAKNFQVVLAHKPRRIVCQYGKIGPNSFGLDIRHPLSVIQAFAMAMAWTLVAAEPLAEPL